MKPRWFQKGVEMKYIPTAEKVTIKWFWVAADGTKIRNNKGFIHFAWDATCSCGWESRTGGAIKASVQRSVDDHKYFVHNYTIASSTRRNSNQVDEFIQNILNGKAGA
jgi:hypothetical protein